MNRDSLDLAKYHAGGLALAAVSSEARKKWNPKQCTPMKQSLKRLLSSGTYIVLVALRPINLKP